MKIFRELIHTVVYELQKFREKILKIVDFSASESGKSEKLNLQTKKLCASANAAVINETF